MFDSLSFLSLRQPQKKLSSQYNRALKLCS